VVRHTLSSWLFLSVPRTLTRFEAVLEKKVEHAKIITSKYCSKITMACKRISTKVNGLDELHSYDIKMSMIFTE